jgi:peptidyl-prolyl cis-trans isomerase C
MSARLPLFASLFLLAGCQGGEQARMDLRHRRGSGGTAVATFGDDAITAEELEQRILEMSPFLRTRYQTVEQRREYVEGLARFELLAREAVRRGLQNDPEVVEAAKKVMVHRLLQEELEKKGSPVSDADVAAWFAQHREDFQKPEMVRLSHIFLAAPAADGGQPGAARVRAEALLKQAQALPPTDLEAFGRLAAAHDEDLRSRPLNGDLRFQSRAELEQAYGAQVAEAGFALKEVGQLSGVVETDGGVHLLKLAGRTPALDVSEDEPRTRARIIQAIRAERQLRDYEALLKRLREQDRLVVDDEALARVQVDLRSPARPPSGPTPGFLAAPSPVAPPTSPPARVPPFPAPR